MSLQIKSVFPLFLMLLFLLNACTKEKDITTVEVEIEEPSEGDIVFLRGTVRDTSETVIDNASLRIQLGDFDTEITTDANGDYEIELPASGEKGLIIAAKSQYNRTIQAVDLNASEVQKDIYLLENTSVQNVDLELSSNMLFTLRGRLVDQFGTPVPDVFLIGESVHDDNDDEVKFSGKTDADGFFEFIEEQKDYLVHFIFVSKFVEPCFDRLVNITSDADESLLDLGNVVFALSTPREITPDVDVDDCQEIDFVNHIYIPNDINIIQERLVEGQSITVCDTSMTGAWMYNGLMSADKQNFNGQFQKIDDFANGQSFSLCTPAGQFVEIRSSTGTFLSTTFSYDAATKTISVNDGSNTITFGWQGSFKSTTNGASYDYSNISSFEMVDANQNILYELNDSRRYYVNWVIRDFAGVLTAEVDKANGDTEFITVRFRL